MLAKKFRFLAENQSGGTITAGYVDVLAYSTDEYGAKYDSSKLQLSFGSILDSATGVTPEYDNTIKLFHGAHLNVTLTTAGSGDVLLYLQRSHDGVAWPTAHKRLLATISQELRTALMSLEI